MISFLQNILQKHYKWLFSILLGIIIISFVFTIGAPGISTSEKRERHDFYGYDLNSQKDMDFLIRGSYLSSLFSTGQPPYNKQFMQEEALTRAILLNLANEIHVPVPKEEQLTAFIKTRPFFADEDGDFDAENYKKFIDSLKDNPQMTPGIVREVLSDDYRIEKIKKAIEGSGVVLPIEAKLYLANMQSSYDVSVIELDFEKFNPKISTEEKDIQKYFDENAKHYEEQASVSVSYVIFRYDAFNSSVKSPSEQDLKEFYDKNQNLFKEGDKLSTFALAKDKVRAEWIKTKAKQLAGKAASDFTMQLYDKNITFKSPDFFALIKNDHLEMKLISKYSKNQLPKDSSLPQELLSQAFLLNENQYFSDPMNTSNGVVVLFFEKLFPAYIPPMAVIREKVTNDYKAAEKSRLFGEEGILIKDQLTRAIAQGKSINDAARGLGLIIKGYKDLSFKNKQADVDMSVLSVLPKLQKGEISNVIASKTGGFLVYVANKTVPIITESSEDFQKTTQSLKSFVSMFATRGVLMEMAERELEKGLKPLDKNSKNSEK